MDLEVDRSDLHRVRIVDGPAPGLVDGQVRLAVEAFALSSNNISYAAFGDLLRYWDVFPAAPDAPGGTTPWGRVPVWGFAEVVESRCAALAEGVRVYGYLPMSTDLVVEPGRFDDRGFSDVAPHRAGVAGAYSRYVRTDADPIHRADREPQQMLLFPLFFTSFVLDDTLDDGGSYAGTEQLWITSASAKTSIGLAFLARRRGATTVVGVTSARNRAFVEGLGTYDRVVTYDAVDAVAAAPAVLVDVAGNADVRAAVHGHLGEHLASSLQVGGTHWDHTTEAAVELVGPRPEFFFAPTQIAKRTREWGQDGLDARLGAAWDAYVAWVDGWLELRHATGPAEVEAVYRELLDNAADPSVGHIATMRA